MEVLLFNLPYIFEKYPQNKITTSLNKISKPFFLQCVMELWATERGTGEQEPRENRNSKKVVELAFIPGNLNYQKPGLKLWSTEESLAEKGIPRSTVVTISLSQMRRSFLILMNLLVSGLGLREHY